MYADTVTRSMRAAIDETNRRRKVQMAYNEAHGIVPKTIVKPIHDVIDLGAKTEKGEPKPDKKLTKAEREKLIEELTKRMKDSAKRLEFEAAAKLRDRIQSLRTYK
jgi:excinuclease ABC subunit B